MSEKIKIILSGGLGNQLFQISAGLFLENKFNCDVYYDCTNFSKNVFSHSGNYSRSLYVKELIDENALIIKNTSQNLNNFLTLFKKNIIGAPRYLFEKSINDNILLNITGKTREIYGFFQNSELVDRAESLLISKMINSQVFAPLVSVVPEDRIGIHVRFGDYSDDAKTKSFHGLTKSSYYQSALKFLSNETSDTSNVVVVTDDALKAKKMFEQDLNLKNVVIFSNSDPISDLEVLAKSKFVILSNSSFSWWGGWLANKNNGAKVIYPRPWLNDLSDPNLLIYPKKWISLKREFET